VKREIVEVATPGLVANADRLEGASANYLAAVLSDGGVHGVAYLDLSTGEFAATETDRREVFEASWRSRRVSRGARRGRRICRRYGAAPQPDAD
jgi:DNA mismatch repair ATPase MutS